MQIPAKWKNLASLAKQAQQHSYSPYSKFRVGCALEDETGRVFTGCNVENASYSHTVCAERAAILKMISEGGHEVRRVAIITDSEEVAVPCGACLQVLQEFGVPEVFVSNQSESKFEEFGLDALLPRRFNRESLE